MGMLLFPSGEEREIPEYFYSMSGVVVAKAGIWGIFCNCIGRVEEGFLGYARNDSAPKQDSGRERRNFALGYKRAKKRSAGEAGKYRDMAVEWKRHIVSEPEILRGKPRAKRLKRLSRSFRN